MPWSARSVGVPEPEDAAITETDRHHRRARRHDVGPLNLVLVEPELRPRLVEVDDGGVVGDGLVPGGDAGRRAEALQEWRERLDGSAVAVVARTAVAVGV